MEEESNELLKKPVLSDINDIRTQGEFKGISFSNYKKTDVRKEFIENMKKGKLEQSCYWCAELICAGHYLDVWDIILHYFGKHIHIGNPKMVIYLEMRYSIFKNIMSGGQYLSEIQLRNNSQFRKLFAEIVSVMTISNKTHSFEPVKINRVEEFDLTQMSEKLKAPSTEYATPIFMKEDPKELFIAINEFAYQLSKESSNTLLACYWIEWVIEFDLICKKKRQRCVCHRRPYEVEPKCQKDIIWLVWDVILERAKTASSDIIQKVVRSVLNLFCIKYTNACCKRRKYLFYLAVALLTEMVDTSIEIIKDRGIVQNSISKIDEVYKTIKKTEQSPKMDYLYTGLSDKQKNFEKSLRRMEMLEQMDFMPQRQGEASEGGQTGLFDGAGGPP
jgi:hypothetical protein